MGEGVGACVGFDGQLVIPNLNVQRALASVCCWTVVGAAVGVNVGFALIEGANVGAVVGKRVGT